MDKDIVGSRFTFKTKYSSRIVKIVEVNDEFVRIQIILADNIGDIGIIYNTLFQTNGYLDRTKYTEL